MKQISLGLVVLFFLTIAPVQSEALSCMDLTAIQDFYQNDDRYTIFTGVGSLTEEFLTIDTRFPGIGNGESGYVAQSVTVSAVHRGSVPETVIVRHQKNATWGFMCSSGPTKPGVESVFIVSENTADPSEPIVVNTYRSDSDFAVDLVESLGVVVEPEPGPVISKEERRRQLAVEIRELIILIRQKFAEWRSLAE